MQKRVEGSSEENLDFERGSLGFSEEKIEIYLQKGQQYEGAFHIYAPSGLYTDGKVISSDWRMECLSGSFSGCVAEILFRFHAEFLEEGDVVKGCFYVISNQGEYYLPFVVSVEYGVLESSIGVIKNMAQFANLAKENWQEACNLFYSSGFSCVLSGDDAGQGENYRALTDSIRKVRGRLGGMGNSMDTGIVMEDKNAVEAGISMKAEQAMEEFLLQTGKKQKVEFLVEESSILLEMGAASPACGVLEQELTIVRNGWGFTWLAIECKGDFLFTEKEVLTDNDFMRNRCRLPVFIDTDLCRRGRHFGEICLRHAYGSVIIPVEVTAIGKEDGDKRFTAQLMKLYQSFRLRKMETSEWLKETGRLVESLVSMDENNIPARLFQAQLLITEGRFKEAEWILDYASGVFCKKQPEDVILAYYLYLTTLINSDEMYISQVAGKVERIYRRDISNWRVAWLLLYLSEEYQKSDRNKWQLLEQLFLTGCTSPVLYIEVLILLNNNPALLRRFGSFEQQVIYYGMRHDFLKKEVAGQICYLAGRAKECPEILLKILEALYEKMDGNVPESVEQKGDLEERYYTRENTSIERGLLLKEICTILIKKGKVGKKYFEWYEAGVKAQLRITNLYEYYMMSMDIEERDEREMCSGEDVGMADRHTEIPRTVLMYFSYQSHMDYTHNAYLYDYMLRHKEELGETYHTYRPKIEQFMMEQIGKGHIDRHLANLYQKLLRPEMLDEERGAFFSRLLFAHLIRVEDVRLKKVYVYQQGNVRPAEYVLSEKQTWISLYGSHYTIVFEDAWGYKFLGSVEYTIEKLMIPGKFLRWLLPVDTGNLELDFYLCESDCIYKGMFHEGIERGLRVVASENADSRLKAELSLRILQYYYDTNRTQALDQYLENFPVRNLDTGQRGEVMKYMVLRRKYDLAGKWLEAYGPYVMEAEILAQLLDALAERYHMEERPVLTAAAVYVFRKGKYSSTMLTYLAMHYEGMTRNLRHVWKAAMSYEVDCYVLSERILKQMLYSGAYVGEKMEIFRYYVSRGAKAELETAFLEQCAFDYFVRERVMEKDVFQEIRQLYLRGESVSKICRLAYLRYDVDCGEAPDETGRAMRETFLTELLEEGIELEFFKGFQECGQMRQELLDKTILEYHTSPGAKARVHYVIPGEDGGAEGYTAEYMKEAYEGVYFKEFVLFFGESLQYYITEEQNGQEQLTESGTLQKSEEYAQEESSRYQLINEIVTRRSLREYDETDHLLEEYYRKDFLNGRLFELRGDFSIKS